MEPQDRIAQLRYRCSQCNDIHKGLPALAFGWPTYIDSIPESERASRCRKSDDLCVVDDEHYFVRGILDLPIIGTSETYSVGAWSTLSATNFAIYEADFFGARSGSYGPFVGWFSNSVPGYAATTNQKCRVHFHADDKRPTFELEPTDHPLAIAQRDGITLASALKIAEAIPGIKFLIE
jgi:hypothetical protein